MALWHDLYPQEEIPAIVGEMSMEAWTMRKRGVDILSLKRKGDTCFLSVKSRLDYALTCAEVNRYLKARFESHYTKVGFTDFIIKDELVFSFVDRS